MSFEKVCQLADRFLEKIAEQHYQEHAPEDKRAEDIKWITEEERRLIKENGTNPTFKPHNPPASVASEKTWDKAKKAVKPYWRKYKEPWGTVFHVYRRMGGKVKKSKKKSPK
jgi:hypothetical protein